MSADDNEVWIEDLEIKLKLAQMSFERLQYDLTGSKRRKAFGVLSLEARQAILANLDVIADRIQTLTRKFENAIDLAGR